MEVPLVGRRPRERDARVARDHVVVDRKDRLGVNADPSNLQVFLIWNEPRLLARNRAFIFFHLIAHMIDKRFILWTVTWFLYRVRQLSKGVVF